MAQTCEVIMPAIVRKIVKVEDHPNPDKPHLGVFTLSNGAVCIGVDPTVGVRRFNVDDLCVHVEPGSVIPMWLMDNGFENLKPKGKVKASNFAGVRSEGIMLDVLIQTNSMENYYVVLNNFDSEVVKLDQDVSSFLGIV